MIPSGFEFVQDATTDFKTGTVLSLVLGPFLFGAFAIPYFAVYGPARLLKSSPTEALVWGFVVLAFFVVHESLHAIGFLAVGAPRRAIHFGIHWKTVTPYCNCRAPVTCGSYRLALLLPSLVLGVLPGLAGIATGLPWLMLFGAVQLVGGSGDLFILWMLRAVSSSAWVLDSEDRIGCEILRLSAPGTPPDP